MDATEYPTTVTIAEGYTVRVSAQTASRDYTAKVIPGTYPISYTTIQGYPVPAGEKPYYARIAVQIESPERRETTVEFAGNKLAWDTIPASTGPYTIIRYGYEVKGRTVADHAPQVTYGYDEVAA